MTVLTTIPNGALQKDIRDTINAMLADVVSLKQGVVTPSPTLSALTLAANSVTENAASGTVVGGILGKTAGSTLSLVNDDGGRFAISGTNLVAGLTNIDYEAATSRSIVLRETLAGATNSPRDTPLAVGVVNVNEQPSLRALLLSSTSLTIGTPASGSITEAATGSAIAASGLPAGFTVNGPARTWAYDGSGPASNSTITLTETLGDSPNSPRSTQIVLTVAAAAAPTVTNGIVNDGDSITEGPNYIPVRPPRPEILAAITGLQTTNLGVSGRKLEAMDATFGSRNVASLFNASNRNTVSLLGGINDLTDTTTVDQLRGWITSYVGKARAAGFRVNLATVLPNGNGSSATNTIRQNFNAWLRANYQSIGAQTLADYDAIPEAALTGSTLWYVDKLHPTPRLLAKMALIEAQAMGVAITQHNPNPRMTDTANIGGYTGYYYNTNYAIQPQDSSQLSYVDGKIRLTATSTRWFPEAHIEINGLVVGQNYRLAYDVPLLALAAGSGYGTRARVAENVGDDFQKTPAYPANADATTGSKTYDFTATKTSMAVTLQLFTDKAASGDFDNITVTAR